jgi:hypothetical protein
MANYELRNAFDGVVSIQDDTEYWVPNAIGNIDWDAYQVWVAVGNTPDPAPTPPVLIPAVVTRYQARAALLQAGLLSQVNAYFDGLGDDDMGKLAWLEAPTVERNSPALIAAAHALGLSDGAIDQLFIAAAAVR